MKTHSTEHIRWDRKTSEKVFKCPFFDCTKSYTSKSSLSVHMASAHDKARIDDFIPNNALRIDCFSTSTDNGDHDRSSGKKRCLMHSAGSNDETQLNSPDFNHLDCIITPKNDVIVDREFLMKTAVKLIDGILEWDSKSPLERTVLKMYATSVKKSVQLMNRSSSSVQVPLASSSPSTTNLISTEMRPLSATDSEATLLLPSPILQRQRLMSSSSTVHSCEEAIVLSQTLISSGVVKPCVVMNPCHAAPHVSRQEVKHRDDPGREDDASDCATISGKIDGDGSADLSDKQQRREE